MIPQAPKLRRQAVKAELEEYLAYHKEILLGIIIGLKNIEIKEDRDGAYFELQVEDVEGDKRELTPEDAESYFYWDRPHRVKARIEIVKLT